MRVVWRHAFANIGVRLVTVLALTYAGLLEGAVLTETCSPGQASGSTSRGRC